MIGFPAWSRWPKPEGWVYIYCVEDIETGRKYVGQTTRKVRRRVKESFHLSKVRTYIIEVVPPEDADTMESYWIWAVGAHRSQGGLNVTWGSMDNAMNYPDLRDLARRNVKSEKVASSKL